MSAIIACISFNKQARSHILAGDLQEEVVMEEVKQQPVEPVADESAAASQANQAGTIEPGDAAAVQAKAEDDDKGAKEGKEDKEPKKRAKEVDETLLRAFRYFDRTGASSAQ